MNYQYNLPYYELHFSSLAEDAVHVLSFEADEEISNIFEYRIKLISDDPELDASKILNQPATFILNRGDEDPVKINGIISNFEQYGRNPDYVFYSAVLVPRIWRLNLVFQNEVYQHMDIKQVIETVLSKVGLSGKDYKIDLKHKYPKMEYIVQYRETSFNFLNRRLEHFGIYYYFEHQSDSDIIVFTDANTLLPSIDNSIGYNINKDPLSDNESISEIMCREQVVTGLVQLKDYNYLFPEKQLMAQSQIDTNQPGLYYDFGDNFTNEKDAEYLAKVRNQEFLSNKKRFFGVSDSRLFRVGYKFMMELHYRDDWNSEYLLTKIRFSGTQQSLFALLPHSGEVRSTFENHFEAIPSDIEFRPPRRTPIPKITGVMSAVIESGSGDQYAFIDDHGRYRMKLLFDISDKSNGQASCPIRLSQPYSGPGYGIHFPNHAKTEVLWACIDGDVDRPMGIGTVPNPSNASPSASGNKAQSVIRTAGQNELTMDDTKGNENIFLNATKDWTIAVANDKKQKVGHDENTSVGNNRTTKIENNETLSVASNETISVGGNRDKSVSGNQTEKVTGNKSIKVDGNHDEKISGNLDQSVDQNKNETISADKKMKIGGNYNVDVSADMKETVGSSKTVNVSGNISESSDQSISVKAGLNYSGEATIDYSAQSGGKMSLESGGDFKLSGSKKGVIEIADELTIKCGQATISLKKNGDISINGKKINIKASGDMVMKGQKILEN